MRLTTVLGRLTFAMVGMALIHAHGSDYYVSTQGSDSNPGTSSQPFRTITRAYSLAGPGTTIIVKPGVYTDYTKNWGLRLHGTGTASNPIILKSEVRGQAVIDGRNASDRNKAVYIDGSYNVVDGFRITGGPNGGITIYGNGNRILNNEIHNNGNAASSSTYGRDGAYSDRTTRDNVYMGNYIHDNGREGSGGNLDHGLYLCGDNEVAANNVLLRNTGSGIQVAGYSTVSNLKIYNNVMAHNGTQGIILWLDLDGVDIKNNILYGNATYGINTYDAHGSGVVVDRNQMFGNSLGNYHLTRGGSDFTYTLGTNLSSDPSFLNSSLSGFDSHLNTGSPAFNAGLNLSSTFTTDMDGADRPSSGQWDLGVYQHDTADTTPPSVALTAPSAGATLSGSSVSIAANASDNVGVAGVQFKMNGSNLGSEDTTAPYGVALNTTSLANGYYSLTAVARDAAGNQTVSDSVSVLVDNNTAPTISSISNQTISAGGSTGPIAFTVGDAETSAGNLSVTGSSSNSSLVLSGNIVIGGTGSNRTVTVTPESFLTGTTTITLTVSDGALSRSTSFSLTVNALPEPVVALTSPADGSEHTAPASLDLAASVDANGNLINKVQFYSGTSLVGEDLAAPYSHSLSEVPAGSYSFTAKAVYNAGSTVTSGAVSVTVATAPPSDGLSLDASSAVVTAPFTVENGAISQPSYTKDPASGGKAAYTFNISTPGNYVISTMVDAPNNGANSFFVNIDNEPDGSSMIWDVPVTSGMATRVVAWRGNGSPNQSEFDPKVFYLSAGTHVLIVRGREGGCRLGQLTVEPYGTNTPPAVVLTAPVDGASYQTPATIDMSASVNSNGHVIDTVRFYRGNTLLGEDASAPYLFSWSNAPEGSHSLTARAVYAGTEESSSSVNVTVHASETDPSITFSATSGTIVSPFVAGNGVISQPSYTASVTAGGRASYTFTVPADGEYTIVTRVDAPSEAANSFFVNIDGEPVDPTMIWDIPLTSGFEERTVSWRGNGTPTSNEFAPKVFFLTAGSHELVVRGREGNCRLESITIEPVPSIQLASVSKTSLKSEPGLKLSVVNGRTRVSWPSNAGNFVLQSRSELSKSSIWTDVGNVPETIGEEQVVVMPYSMDNSLFRLRAQ